MLSAAAVFTCTVWGCFTGVDGGEDIDGFQAFEVLQQWTPNSSTAFFITQPHLTTSTAAVSVGGATSTSSLSADHIIVQAMPMAQVSCVQNEDWIGGLGGGVSSQAMLI